MRAWQYAGLNSNLTDLVESPAIGAYPLLQHLLAEDALAQRFVILA
jgi:hypothetical protein